jgi:regulator of replication initiation timing
MVNFVAALRLSVEWSRQEGCFFDGVKLSIQTLNTGMEAFLKFYFKYQVVIVEVLLGLVVFLGLVYLFRAFLRGQVAGGDDLVKTSTDLLQIEDSLKKILEQQGASKSAGAMAGAVSSPELESKINAKEAEINELKQQLEKAQSAQSGAGAANDPVLTEKIKDLEARLSEYEIIAEDIADLSKFREENKKLQMQIENLETQLKNLSSQTPAPPTPALPTAVAEIPQPVAKETPPPAAPEPVENMATEPVPEVAAAISPSPVAASDSVIDDDILAEFAKAVDEQKATSAVSGEIDINKMANEALNLPQPEADTAANSLDGEMNQEKLLQEASSMEDEKKLMGEFAEFAKKDAGTA